MSNFPVGTSEDSSQKMLETWVDQHGSYLLRIARRFVPEEAQAQDLLQETFLAAAEHFSQFEFRSSPRTWLTGILRHKALDLLRRKKLEAKHFVPPPLEELSESGFDQAEHWTAERGPLSWRLDPQNYFQQRQFLQHLEKCLNKLPPVS